MSAVPVGEMIATTAIPTSGIHSSSPELKKKKKSKGKKKRAIHDESLAANGTFSSCTDDVVDQKKMMKKKRLKSSSSSSSKKKKKKGKSLEMDAEQHSQSTKKTKTKTKTKSKRRSKQPTTAVDNDHDEDGYSSQSTLATTWSASSHNHNNNNDHNNNEDKVVMVGMIINRIQESSLAHAQAKKDEKKKLKSKTKKTKTTKKSKTKSSDSVTDKKKKKQKSSKKDRVAQIMAAHQDAMSLVSTAQSEHAPTDDPTRQSNKTAKQQSLSSSKTEKKKTKKKTSKVKKSPRTEEEPIGTQSPKPPVALLPLSSSSSSHHSPKGLQQQQPQRRWTMSPGTPTRRMSATNTTTTTTMNSGIAPSMPLLSSRENANTSSTTTTTTIRPFRRWSLMNMRTNSSGSMNMTIQPSKSWEKQTANHETARHRIQSRRKAFRLGRSHSWNSQLAANNTTPLPFPENEVPNTARHAPFTRSHSDSRLDIQQQHSDDQMMDHYHGHNPFRNDEPLWNADASFLTTWHSNATIPLRPRVQPHPATTTTTTTTSCPSPGGGSDHDSMECAPDDLMACFDKDAFPAGIQHASPQSHNPTKAGDLDALMRTSTSSGSPLLDDLISSFDANKSTSSAFTNGTQELTQSSAGESLEMEIRECPPVVPNKTKSSKTKKTKKKQKKKGLLMSQDSMAFCSSQLLDRNTSVATLDAQHGGTAKKKISARKVKQRDGSVTAHRPPRPETMAKRRMSSKELSDFMAAVSQSASRKTAESKKPPTDLSSSATSFFDVGFSNEEDGSLVSLSGSMASEASKRFDDSFASFTSSLENSSTFEDCQAQVEEEEVRLDSAMNKIQTLFLQQRQKERTKRLEDAKDRIRRKQAEKQKRRDREASLVLERKRLLVLEWFRRLGMPRKGAFRAQLKRMGEDFCGISKDDVELLKWGINGLIDPRELSVDVGMNGMQTLQQ